MERTLTTSGLMGVEILISRVFSELERGMECKELNGPSEACS